MTRSQRLALAGGVVLVISVASVVRLARLGAVSLDFDEYLHVVAAQQLLESGQPRLPSGTLYTRALPYTRIVSEGFRWFGVSEASARLPSVLFGIGLVLLAGWMAWRWWGRGAALVVMLLLALDPYGLQMSRVCRMYTLFHFLYIGVLYALYEGLEGRYTQWKRWMWWGLAGLGFLLALMLQKLAVDLLAGVAAYVVIQAILTRRKTYWVLTVLGGLAAAAVMVFRTDAVEHLWHEMNWAPAYAAQWRYDAEFYLRHFWAVDPYLVGLFLPALAWWGLKDRPRGWYLGCAALVPFLLHSFIFDWKNERYLLQIIPVMWLMVGGALAGWVGALASWLRRSVAFGRPGALGRLAPVAASFLLLPPVLGLLAAPPRTGLDGTVAQWREAYQVLRPVIRPDDQLLVSVPLVSAYYLHRLPDYVLLNVLISDSGKQASREADGFYHDWYTGRPLVTSIEEIAQVMQQHPRGWIVVDADRFPYDTCVVPAVREFIVTRCRKWVMPDPSVIVYSWGI